MEQNELRDWERRCIQEEPPKCQAACPIHVDVRAFMGRMKAGDFDAARKILEKTMPLPGVLGRLCDHPCEAACIRAGAGGPLAVGGLERVCVENGRQGPKPLVLPSKGKKAAVLGEGMAALTCAWDLIRKGFGVTLLVPGETPGGRLATLGEDLLPAKSLEDEIARLKSLGVAIRTGRALDSGEIRDALASFDAVFAEYGTPPCPPGRKDADPGTLLYEDVFCGGWPGEDGKFSIMAETADGRRAASSMDRYMSGVSLTASREKEGPCASRLFTSLEGMAAAARVEPTDPGSAKAEAARCMECECMECVKTCTYLEHYKGYPKKYARQIYNNAAIVQGVHQANTMINSCSLCGLCATVCPEDFDMGELCLTARRDMVRSGKMPPSAHEFALEDMAFNNGPGFALSRCEPGALSSAFLFFPGCQLCSSHPHHVTSLYGYLRERLSGGVGLMLRCCGAPALWAGRQDLFDQASEEILRLWKQQDQPRVVTACASCLALFKKSIPELAPASIWEILGELGLPGAGGARPQGTVAVHDPCSLNLEPGVRGSVREALRSLGVAFEELPGGGGNTECCGYGGLMDSANPSLAGEVVARKAAESPLDYAASCSMCRDRLAATGKRTWHVLDFIFPGPETDPAAKGPGYSDRHENRSRLKAGLLREVWGESSGEDRGGLAATGLRMEYAPEAAEAMEARRILREDVEAVLAQAEATGRKLEDKAGGRFLAYHRPRRVTYWVEYSRRGDVLAVHRVWSHRMNVPGAAAPKTAGEAS